MRRRAKPSLPSLPSVTPLSSWLLLAAAVAGLVLWTTLAEVGLRGPGRPAAVAVAGLWVTALLLVRISPLAMAVTAGCAAGAFGLLPDAPDSTPFLGPLLICFFAGLTLEAWRLVIGLTALAAGTLVMAVGSIHDQSLLNEVVSVAVLVGGPVAVGGAVRRQRGRTAQLRHLERQLASERAAHERDSAAAERNRIARDLHDLIAHSVSVMVVQAGAAEALLPADAPAGEPLRAVRLTGRDTLAELRRQLGVLRDAGHP